MYVRRRTCTCTCTFYESTIAHKYGYFKYKKRLFSSIQVLSYLYQEFELSQHSINEFYRHCNRKTFCNTLNKASGLRIKSDFHLHTFIETLKVGISPRKIWTTVPSEEKWSTWKKTWIVLQVQVHFFTSRTSIRTSTPHNVHVNILFTWKCRKVQVKILASLLCSTDLPVDRLVTGTSSISRQYNFLVWDMIWDSNIFV